MRCSRSRPISARRAWVPVLVTKTTSRPWPLMDAPTTSSPGPTSTGTDSPVSNERSTHDLPSFTTPSAGIFSPGRTTTRSPGRTRSTGTVRSSPATSTVASFAPRSSRTRPASPAVRARPRFQRLADQDQRDDHGRRVEVVVAVTGQARRTRCSRRRRASPGRSGCPSWSSGAAPPGPPTRRNGHPATNTTGRGQRPRQVRLQRSIGHQEGEQQDRHA